MTEHTSEDAERTDGTARTGSDGPLNASRRTYCKALAAAAVGATVSGSATADPAGGDHGAVMDLVPPSNATHTATASGSWNDGAVWAGGAPPGDGAQVHVESGVTVTIDHQDAARLAWVRVDGTLAFDPSTDTRLGVDTLVTTEGSSLEVGTQASPIQPGVTAEIEFVDRGPIDENWDPTRVSRGLLPMGDVEIVGSETTGHTTLATPPTSGDGSLQLESAPTNWSAGDSLVVPGVSPRENEDEEVTIASVSGTTVSLAETIQYDHSPPAADLDSYVCNLDRNVRLSSESTDVGRRGHVMLMSRGSTMEYTGLYELGRTDKSSPFSDPLYKESEIRNDGVFDLAINDNRKARYPVHFHKTGAYRDVEPHQVTGCVVAPHTDSSGWKGSPGWGFTNHQSYAHVQDCVSYQVYGTHFMTETGNEIGTFHDNFALRSEGTGDDPDWREFIAWANHANRPLIDDYGHGGHGFWLHGPLVSVENNVAAGHRNFAYAYWTRSLGDFVPDDVTDPAVPPAELDRDVVEADIGRHRGEIPQSPASYGDDKPSDEHNVAPGSAGPNVADFAHATFDAGGTTYVDPGSIPIRNVDNVAFASGAGMDVMNHMRGVEGTRDTVHGNDDYYGLVKNFTAFNIGARTGESDLPRFEMRQGGEVNFEFPRGVDIGISMRYANHLKVENPRLVGMGDGAGIVHNMRTRGLSVQDATIENWADGIGALTDGITEISNPTFSNISNSEINVRGEQILAGQPTTHLEGVDASDEIYLDATADVSSDWEWAITLDGGDVYYDQVAPPEAEDDPRLTGGQVVGGSGGGGGGAPSAPSNLSSPDQTTSSIDLDWDHDGTNTAYYNVFVDGTVEATPSGTSATISGLDQDTTYGIHVTADDGSGTQSSDSNSISVSTGAGSSGPDDVVAAIDAGGDGHTAADGTTFDADADYSGGNTASVGDDISGTDDDPLYRTERWGDFSYDVSVPNGTYDVELHFAENFFESNGARVFSVSLEGTEVLSGLDVHAEVGHDAAHVETISDVEVTDESLSLTASASVDNPKLNAIRILDAGSDGGSGGGGTDPGLPTTLDAVNYDSANGGFQTEANGEGGQSIGWIGAGDWWAFDAPLDADATTDISVRVAAPDSGTTLHVEVDGVDVSGPVSLPATGGWYAWQHVTAATGVDVSADSEVRVVADTGSWNFDEVRLE